MLSVIRTGLDAAMQGINVISNNIANAGSTGFKRSRAEFSDIYATAIETPRGSDLGLGARRLDPRRFHEQGGFKMTGNALDLAINGEGLFTFRNEASGQLLYTRDGSINITNDGNLVSDEGYSFLDINQEPVTVPFSITRPDGTIGTLTEIAVQGDGTINASYGPQYTATIATLGLAQFRDPSRLQAEGSNFFSESPESGEMVMSAALINNAGYFQAGALEMSNVDITDEMTMMLRAQQAYSGSSRLMQSEVEMVRRLIG